MPRQVSAVTKPVSLDYLDINFMRLVPLPGMLIERSYPAPCRLLSDGPRHRHSYPNDKRPRVFVYNGLPAGNCRIDRSEATVAKKAVSCEISGQNSSSANGKIRLSQWFCANDPTPGEHR